MIYHPVSRHISHYYFLRAVRTTTPPLSSCHILSHPVESILRISAIFARYQRYQMSKKARDEHADADADDDACFSCACEKEKKNEKKEQGQ